ncbi:MAG: 16S rRNA (adenine(1518)-N(6)/adenine(1519)-N(6))-dimethyltransferase, partial [Actinobacteria bacterium]
GGANRAAAAIAAAGIDPGARGESLTVEQVAAIAAALDGVGDGAE